MKITSEHYGLLKGYIKQSLRADNLTIGQIEIMYQDKSETRKLWDLYWLMMSKPWGKMIVRPVMDQYYDAHIETALRKAFKEIKGEMTEEDNQPVKCNAFK